MEPQFILNVGCLDKFNLTAEDFLELLKINLKTAITANADFGCPKCKRTKSDAYFIYHTYQDFKFGTNSGGSKVDYSWDSIDYYLCICGCLYYSGTRTSHVSLTKEEKPS